MPQIIINGQPLYQVDLPEMTLAQWLALPVAERPKEWIRTDAEYTDIPAENVSYGSGSVKDALDAEGVKYSSTRILTSSTSIASIISAQTENTVCYYFVHITDLLTEYPSSYVQMSYCVLKIYKPSSSVGDFEILGNKRDNGKPRIVRGYYLNGSIIWSNDEPFKRTTWDGTNGSGISFSNVVSYVAGGYLHIGNLVHFEYRLSIKSALTANTEYQLISGLPAQFSSSNVTAFAARCGTQVLNAYMDSSDSSIKCTPNYAAGIHTIIVISGLYFTSTYNL